MSDSTVIILGASTRAAATSARRAGWTPWCADLYADADLERIATVRKVLPQHYPQELLDAVSHAPQAPVIYIGAMENRPDLIARIDRPLWGNAPDVLRAIRSPEQWSQCLSAHGLPCPAVSTVQPTRGRWLLKPRKSAGGFGIQSFTGQAFNSRTHYLQERIDGVPCSAAFLGMGRDAVFLGATEQLVGVSWLNATGFHYAGSLGPLEMPAETTSRWCGLGRVLARAFDLRGLFGIDAILCDGVPWPVEINPRYTASIEILERAIGWPLLRWHRDAFEKTGLTSQRPNVARTYWSKGVLFARATIAFPHDGPWNDDALKPGVDLDVVGYADIPHAGETIERGQPVMTVFASAPTAEECRAKLQEKSQALDRCLWG